MALQKTMTLNSIGLDNIEVAAYINVSDIVLRKLPRGLQLNVMMNVYTSESARRMGKAPIEQRAITLNYTPLENESLHTFVYRTLKVGDFSGSIDV